MKYLVDTDTIIDALKGLAVARATLDRLSRDGVAVGIVSLGELYEGAFGSADPIAAQRTIRLFVAGFAMLTLTDEIVLTFGRTRAMLRRRGRLIPDFDLLIAATALATGLTLVTRNRRHFARIPDLQLYSVE